MINEYVDIDSTKILKGNKGYIVINGINLAELKSIEIKLLPKFKTISTIDSMTDVEFVVACNGSINFELYKVFSRFKPALLESYKHGRMFMFSLECYAYNDDGEEEGIYIGNCWFNGEVMLNQLNAEGDFVNEKYSAGFQIESADFTENGTIKDGLNWESL